MKLEAMAIKIPAVAGHPNRIAFEGVLTLVDEASDRAPSGARGHRVLLTRAAAMAALPSLLGMAVDYRPGWDGHDARRKCGIITDAEVRDGRVCVAGYLYSRDFPEVEEQMKRGVADSMGMSYELADAHVADMRAEVWTLTRATFTGAAILLRAKAAYQRTEFRITAAEVALPVVPPGSEQTGIRSRPRLQLRVPTGLPRPLAGRSAVRLQGSEGRAGKAVRCCR